MAESGLFGLRRVSQRLVPPRAKVLPEVCGRTVIVVHKDVHDTHTMGQSKVGGRLGSDLTLGVKSVKEKAYLDGPHSTIVGAANFNWGTLTSSILAKR
jgi:hypothetical protein